jgi:tetratricopeptide (TPR) repeat protein
MDDEVVGPWHIAPEIRAGLRLQTVKKALDQGDWQTAVLEAEELLHEEPEHQEALFLLAEALLELGDVEGAREAYEQHLELATQDPSPDPARMAGALCGLAVARYECCDLPGSVEAARECIRIAPDLAEAHYYLGLALERMPGRKSESVTPFIAANRLDPEAYPLPVQLSPRQWEGAVKAAVGLLPSPLQRFWSGVPIRLEEAAPIEELRQAEPPITPTVGGLYVGTPPDEAGNWDEKPEALRLFTGNLARKGSVEAVTTEIAATLKAEALDWLGITEDDLP